MQFTEPKEYYNADYKPHFHQLYAGNPLVEALPQQYSKAEFLACMTYIPDLPVNLWDMPFSEAQIYIKELERAYIPNEQDYEIYRHLHNEIISGYRHRNPALPLYHSKMLLLAGEARNSQQYRPNPHHFKQISSGSCTLISGLSGIGKTEKIRAMLKMLPPVIRHQEFNGEPQIFDQIVTVSFEISTVRSVKALALNFFAAVDKIIGTTNVIDWKDSRAGVPAYLIEMQLIVMRHGIGLVHIDECQKLLSEVKSNDHPTIQLLESMFNLIGVPVIMTTTNEGRKLFGTNSSSSEDLSKKFQSTRRLTSSRDIVLERMYLDGDEFRRFLACFLPDNIFAGTAIKSKAFEQLIFDKCQGVHQVLNRLLRVFLENLHRRQTTQNNYEQLFLGVFDDQFKLLKPALQALKDGDAQTYELHKAATDEVAHSGNKLKGKSRTNHSSLKAPIMATEANLKGISG